MNLFVFGLVVGLVIAFGFMALKGRFLPDNSKSDGNDHSGTLLTPPLLLSALFAACFLIMALIIDASFVRPKVESWSLFLFDPKTYLAVTKELFFASFIALFIVMTVEYTSRREQNKTVNDALAKMKRSVFQAVFSRRIGEDVAAEIEKSIYDCSFVRNRHSRSIILKELEERSADYILMESTQTFRVQNINNGSEDYEPTVILPNPTPEHVGKNTVKKVRISSIGADGEILETTDITDDKIAGAIKANNDSVDETHYVFDKIHLKPDEELEVEYTLELVKERYDNEIWTTLIPTLKADVVVTSKVPDLYIGAISMHRGNLSRVHNDNGFKRWSVEKAMLPYQGYVVFWRKG